jgi:RNA polymerase sigma-70 factor (ECF subfamily)
VSREKYVGPWLPEPLVGERRMEEQVGDRETLSLAFLVLLESLNPQERAVFLLREVFDYDYAEVAEIVGKSEANCRQIARRARDHVAAKRHRFAPSQQRKQELSARFAAACVRGDLPGLIAVLDRDITLWSDGGGKAPAALNPIYGSDKVARFILGVLRKFGERITEPALVNGEPGFITWDEGRVVTALALEIADDRIVGIHSVRNPDKLSRIDLAPSRAASFEPLAV